MANPTRRSFLTAMLSICTALITCGCSKTGPEPEYGKLTVSKIYESCSRTRFPLPTEEELDQFADRKEVVLPPQYKLFLLDFNGGSFRDLVVSTGGGKTDVLTYLHGLNATFEAAEIGEGWILFEGTSLIPIGGTGFGSLILLDLHDGRVLAKQPFDDSTAVLANDIGSFFKSLKIKQE